MKLFSRDEVQKNTAIQRDKEIGLGVSLAKEVDRVRANLNKEKDNKERTEKKLADELLAFSNECMAKKNVLMSEIIILEAERAELMMPVDDILAEAKKVKIDADERLKSVKGHAVKLQIASQKITENLSRLDRALDETKLKEQTLIERERRIKNQESFAQVSSKKLSEAWDLFHKASTNMNTELTRKEKEIEDLKGSLKVLIAENQKKSKELDEESTHIASQRQALKQAQKKLLGKN